MEIQAINNNTNTNNISMQAKHWKNLKEQIAQKAIDAIPKHTVKESPRKIEAWEKIDGAISRPAENRGIMGLTALCTQPLIDANNHKVDEETRIVSRNRTIAKIIAGTGVGMFVVRGPIYKAIQAMTNIKGDYKYSKTLLPKAYLKEITDNPKFLKNYRSALAMAIALIAMCVTNFVLDAPFTAYLTNYLNDKTGVSKK